MGSLRRCFFAGLFREASAKQNFSVEGVGEEAIEGWEGSFWQLRLTADARHPPALFRESHHEEFYRRAPVVELLVLGAELLPWESLER